MSDHSTDAIHQEGEKKSELAEYLEKSGLSFWLNKENGSIASLQSTEIVLDHHELTADLEQPDFCCGGSTCNGSCK